MQLPSPPTKLICGRNGDNHGALLFRSQPGVACGVGQPGTDSDRTTHFKPQSHARLAEIVGGRAGLGWITWTQASAAK